MKIFLAICFGCALVAISECQDMTSLMFQAMGMEAPPIPPMMPASLRQHLYRSPRQQQLQRMLQQQKQRFMAYLASQQQQQQLQQQQQQQQQRFLKDNPYSISYPPNSVAQPRTNSVYSSANRIRVPGLSNSVASAKGAPYTISYQTPTRSKAPQYSGSGNPYSVSRAASSGIPAVRNKAALARLPPVVMPPQAMNMFRTMQTMRAVREHPRKISDAKTAGCRLPSEGVASFLMYGNCQNPAAQMVCQSEMMTCMNVGMSAMCCPFGMNNLALDTIGYVNKLQHFVSELV